MRSIYFLALLLAVHAYEEFRGDQVLRITPKNDAQLQFLKQWIKDSDNLDVWAEPSAPGHNVDVHVHNNNIADVKAMLEKNKIAFGIMVDDVEDLLNEEEASNYKNAFYGSFDYTKYNQWSEIKMELQNLARKYRGRASLFEVGKTYEGEIQLGIKVTNGDGRAKPVVWIDGGIHAREWISPATVMYFMNKMLTDGSDSRVSQALARYDFYFLPVFNIDGYKYTFGSRSSRFWRKTRSRYGWYCYGADPNRNWDSHWYTGVGTSNRCSDDIYRGPKPFSEIEVLNVAKYLKTLNLKSYWNVHAYSQLVLTPWSYQTSLPRDYTEIKRVGDIFANAVSQRYGTRYRVGPPSRILYAVSGGSIDYTYETLGVTYSYALELRDTGRYGFVLPASQIRPSGEETSDAFLAAVLAMK